MRLLAEQFGAHVLLYHAVELPFRDYVRWVGYESDVLKARSALAAQARVKLEHLGSALRGSPEVVIQDDVPATAALVDLALLRVIERSRPDLVVMATHSRGALGSFFLGSVTQQVIQNAGVPVLCVGPRDGGPAHRYRRIVAPTDFSDASRRAFPVAALLARAFAAEVIAMHVVPWPVVTALSDNAGVLAAAVPSDAALLEFVKEFDQVKVTPRVERGAPWNRIVAVAEETQADLIVMSTRGADSLSDDILGSQTERVIRRAGCPVLVV